MVLDQHWDWLSYPEWTDTEENPVNPYKTLESDMTDEVVHIITEVGERLNGERLGHIQFQKFEEIFSLLEFHSVPEWCSESLKQRLELFRKTHDALLADLSEEWRGY